MVSKQSRIPFNAGFSLIEICIALTVIGVLMGGLWKGKALLDNARLTSVIQQVSDIRLAIEIYRDQNGPLTHEPAGVWWQLYSAGLLPQGTAPQSRLDGHFNVVTENGTWLLLHKGDVKSPQPTLTPKQAQALKNKVENGKPTEGGLRFKDGNGKTCLQGEGFNLDEKNPACLAYFQL